MYKNTKKNSCLNKKNVKYQFMSFRVIEYDEEKEPLEWLFRDDCLPKTEEEEPETTFFIEQFLKELAKDL